MIRRSPLLAAVIVLLVCIDAFAAARRDPVEGAWLGTCGTDKERMKTLWVDMLGLTQTGTFQSERENVDEDILSLGQGVHAVEVDIMQPIDPDKKPAVHATPLNHVGLWIDDLPVAVKWLTAQGVRFAPGGIRQGAAGHDICFLHPKSNSEFPISGEGVLIELVQAPDSVVAVLG